MLVGGPACVNTEAVTDPALPRPMSEDYQAGHPTPPPELFRQCEGMPRSLAFEAAYRAGADQELEACCEWMVNHFHGMKDWAAKLRADRRPPPPSLSEQALEALDRMDQFPTAENQYIIRRALERLQELEGNG